MSFRQKIAARTPTFVRKGVRMAEHYAHRHVEWSQVLREMSGVSARDKLILGASALAAPFTSLRRLDGFEPPLPFADLTINTKGVGQFSIRAGTDDITHVLSAREHAVREVLEENLQPGDTFIDAGANIGFFSVVAHNLVGYRGQIIAFEMMPETAKRLRQHFTVNGLSSARIVEKALFDKDGDTITATSSSQKFGQASISEEFQNEPERTIHHTVETVRLDTALSDIGDIKLMKMDLEGAELGALNGAMKVLGRTQAIIFENNSKDQRVEELLSQLGFSIRYLGGREYLASRNKNGE